MSYIDKIKTYIVPFELDSADRFIEEDQNLDVRFQTFFKEEFLVSTDPSIGQKFSYNQKSTTIAEVTITGELVNYMQLTSKLFNNTTGVSYWFLTKVEGVPSSKAYKYSAVLDVMATFGKDIFDDLDGKKIEIKRAHEDRYTYDIQNEEFNMNKNAYSLINTDIKASESVGSELIIDGANHDQVLKTILDVASPIKRDSSDTSPHTFGDSIGVGEVFSVGPPIGYTIINNTDTDGTTIDIVNGIDINDKRYWKYALVNLSGTPTIFDRPSNNSGRFVWDDTYRENNGNDMNRETALVPIQSIQRYDFGSNDFEAWQTQVNTLEDIDNLQKNKVVNLFYLPFKIETIAEGESTDIENAAFTMTWFGENEKRIAFETVPPNQSADAYDSDGDKVTVDLIQNHTFFSENLFQGKTKMYQLNGFRNLKSTNFTPISISNNKLSANKIMDKIYQKLTKLQMKDIVDANENEEIEIALLNPFMSKISMIINNQKFPIDTYNFLKTGQTDFTFKYTLNEEGCEITFKISDNQYIKTQFNNVLSFATEAGATYLANNKHVIDAQMKRVDLEKKLQLEQNTAQRGAAGAAAANPISAIFSFGASVAAGVTQSVMLGQERGTIKDLAQNRKDQIQSTIQDQAAGAPSISTASSHNLAETNDELYKHSFNWEMIYPNFITVNKTINYANKFGSNINNWLTFNKDKYLFSRTQFNFLQVAEFKDYINTFDNEITMLLDAEFKKGVRIWHTPTVAYDGWNYEKVIDDALNS